MARLAVEARNPAGREDPAPSTTWNRIDFVTRSLRRHNGRLQGPRLVERGRNTGRASAPDRTRPVAIPVTRPNRLRRSAERVTVSRHSHPPRDALARGSGAREAKAPPRHGAAARTGRSDGHGNPPRCTRPYRPGKTIGIDRQQGGPCLPFTLGKRARLRAVAVASPGSLVALRSGSGFGVVGGLARGDGGT